MIALSREQVAAAHYQMALLDPLTGIGNRRALQDHITALPQVRGSGRGLAIPVFDIDRFKSVNDGRGHAFGDTIIVKAASVARKVLRGKDEVFRIGGEEFACVLTDVSEQAALAIGERLRVTFERDARKVAGVALDATISIGVATSGGEQFEAEALLTRADDALYEAKRGGRNRCVLAKDSLGRNKYSPPGSNQ